MRVSLAGSSEDGTLSYRLVQKIAEPGDQVGTAKFRIASLSGASETVEVSVRYYGVIGESR